MIRDFTLSEFLESRTAEERGIDNTPSFEVVAHLQELTECILQPLRTAWGSGIRINSGYRSPALNKAVGGSRTSVHQLGYAADIFPVNGKFGEFTSFAIGFIVNNDIEFDQILIESSGAERWLHIGLYNNAGTQRRQILNIAI